MKNTNLLKAVAGDMGISTQVGDVRETIFAHQVRSGGMHIIIAAPGDFLVDGRFLFEIGGKAKEISKEEKLKRSMLSVITSRSALTRTFPFGHPGSSTEPSGAWIAM